MGRWAQARRRGSAVPSGLPPVPFVGVDCSPFTTGQVIVSWETVPVPQTVSVTLYKASDNSVLAGPTTEGPVQSGNHTFVGLTSGLVVYAIVAATAPLGGFSPGTAQTGTATVP